MERDSIVFYKSFFDAIKELPPEDFKNCMTALMEYGFEGKVPETSGIAKSIFLMAKPQIDKNNQRYANGKKGGKTAFRDEPNTNQNATKHEPNTNQNATEHEPNTNQTRTKREPNTKNTEPNDNDNVNVNVNDNDNVNDYKDICSEQASEPPIITLPLNDKSQYPIYDGAVQEWAELYPAVDVIQQLKAMRGWLNANESRRKTRKGINRFINGWLAKEQDKGGRRNAVYNTEFEGVCGDTL